MKKQDKISNMINKIKSGLTDKFDYIDDLKIDLLIPIQRKETAEMKLFDSCLDTLINNGQIEISGNRIRLSTNKK